MPDFPSLSAEAEGQLRQACQELSRRLRAGEACQAEALLQDYPSLVSHPHLALDLILTELRVRQQLGQQPDPGELLRRFPQWHEALQQRLSSLEPLTTNEDSARTPLHQPLTCAPAEDSSAPPAPPPALGPHQVGEVIGQGGMGVVYRAHDQVLDRPVALKVLRSGLLASNVEVERFYREARASARLRHAHIVPIHGMGLYQGQHCFTMPLLTGGTLSRQLSRLRQDLRAGVALLEKVARAVHVAHEQGVIHRDLKPSNILLDEQGEPHVSDFGLAKLLDVPTDATSTGLVLGTPAYMAPEQAAGQSGKATAATDVWALGVILYEMLVGRRPFQGKTGTDTSWQVLNTEPPRPRALQPRVPRDLQTITLTCLQKDPCRRYASAAALAEDLARWLQAQPIQARPEGWLRWGGRALARAPRGKIALVLGAAALLLFLLLRPGTPAPPAPPLSEQEKQRAEALAALQANLDAGQRTPLIDALGPPRWYNWRVGGTGVPLQARGTPCEVSAWNRCLLELLPDPRCERYRFSVEVRHVRATEGQVGLYFRGDTDATPDGPQHRFVAYTFAGRGEQVGQVQIHYVRYHEGGVSRVPDAQNVVPLANPFHLRERTLACFGSTVAQGPFLSLALVEENRELPLRWHRLSVLVEPEATTFSWDGQSIQKLSSTSPLHPLIGLWWRNLHRGQPVLPPFPFPARGSLGLYLERSEAEFRNAFLEPLPQR